MLWKWCLKRYIRTWLLSGSSVENFIFLICNFFPVSFRLFLLYFVNIRRIFLSDYSFLLLQKWCLKRYIRTWLLSGSSVEYLIFLICKFFHVSFRLFLLYFVNIRRIFLSDYSFSLLQKWCLKRYIRTWLLSGSSVEYLIFLICKFFPVSFRLFLLYFVNIRRISQLFIQIIVFHCCRNDVWNDISELDYCRDLVLKI